MTPPLAKSPAANAPSLMPHEIAFRFVAFAGVATAMNILAQEVVIRGLPSLHVMASILAGTAAGFVVKYLLDKWWVFYDDHGTAVEEARKVTIYALCSVLTTAIFWVVEIAFWKIWGTSFAKYTGAVIGLAIGYTAKYFLDLRYVFTGPRS
ncbi:MAG: GtrA family protein [Hyphomicrobium sp.]